MITANEISLWLLGARRLMTDEEIRAHAKVQQAANEDGITFWNAVLGALDNCQFKRECPSSAQTITQTRNET